MSDFTVFRQEIKALQAQVTQQNTMLSQLHSSHKTMLREQTDFQVMDKINARRAEIEKIKSQTDRSRAYYDTLKYEETRNSSVQDNLGKYMELQRTMIDAIEMINRGPSLNYTLPNFSDKRAPQNQITPVISNENVPVNSNGDALDNLVENNKNKSASIKNPIKDQITDRDGITKVSAPHISYREKELENSQRIASVRVSTPKSHTSERPHLLSGEKRGSLTRPEKLDLGRGESIKSNKENKNNTLDSKEESVKKILHLKLNSVKETSEHDLPIISENRNQAVELGLPQNSNRADTISSALKSPRLPPKQADSFKYEPPLPKQVFREASRLDPKTEVPVLSIIAANLMPDGASFTKAHAIVSDARNRPRLPGFSKLMEESSDIFNPTYMLVCQPELTPGSIIVIYIYQADENEDTGVELIGVTFLEAFVDSGEVHFNNERGHCSTSEIID